MKTWAEVGPIDDLVREALELAADEALLIGPRTKVIRLRQVRRWQEWAGANGAHHDRPLPEELGLFLIALADRGLNPRTLNKYVDALDWWFTATGAPAARPVAIARAVVDGLQRSRPPRSAGPRVEPMDIPQLLTLVTQAPARESWRLRACVLARRLGLSLQATGRLDPAQVAFAGEGATIVVGGSKVRLAAEDDLLVCPVMALRFLIGRCGRGPLLSVKEALTTAARLGEVVGERLPSRYDDDTWARVVHLFARSLRVQRRDVAGVCLGLAGLLGLDESVALQWEHLAETPAGLVAHGTAGAPLTQSLEGRHLMARRDALDALTALAALAAVWPWPGDGLFGCRGPILSGMDPRYWGDGPVALSPVSWAHALAEHDKPYGFGLSQLRLRVTGALLEWDAHQDEVRLQRRLGHRSVISTRHFLRGRSVLHENPTKPEAS